MQVTEEIPATVTKGPLPAADHRKWKVCTGLDDLHSVQYDIDSVVLYGLCSFSWIKPKIQFSCELNRCGALHWDDRKVKEQLSTAAKITVYPGYQWVNFRFGGCNVDSINVVAVVKTDEVIIDSVTGQPEPILANFRKRFFEQYVYKALRIAESKSDHQTHTRLANSLPDLPSESKLYIYPEIWASFCDIIDKLLADQLPQWTDAIYVNLQAHGLKSDAADPHSIVYDRLSGIVQQGHPKLILAQVHVAANLQNQQQVIVADFRQLKNCFPQTRDSRCNKYEYFLFDRLGAFTSHRHCVGNADSAQTALMLKRATYVQFYPENAHILMKAAPPGKKYSHFANATFGDVGNVIPQVNLSKELQIHSNNLQARINLEEEFLNSCRRGVAARFEIVFTFLNDDVGQFFPNLRAIAPTSSDQTVAADSTLRIALNHMLAQMMKGQIILSSSETWWTTRHLDWFETNVFRPLLRHSNGFDIADKPLTVDTFNYIYDLQIVNNAFMMGSWNPEVDAKRLKQLKLTKYNLMPLNNAGSSDSVSAAPPAAAAADYQKWYDPRLMSRCGYSCSIVNHIDAVLREAANDRAQQRQRQQNPFITLYAQISSYCTVAWHLSNVGRPRKYQKDTPSVFSKQSFDRGSRRPRYRLFLAEACCTTHAIHDSILDPITAIGQILLAQMFDRNTLLTLKGDPRLKRDALAIINRNVQYFPTFMLNPRYVTSNITRRWYYWSAVDNSQIIGAGHSGAGGSNQARSPTEVPRPWNNRFHPYRVPDAKPKYDTRLNLKQYRK